MTLTSTGVPPQHAVDISEHFNNIAVTSADQSGSGQFNVWRNSFAREYLPDGDLVTIVVDAITFRLCLNGSGAVAPDNIRCDGQLVEVPRGRYDWIHLVAAGERRVEDDLSLHFAEGTVDFEHVRVSDFWSAPAVFGESVALRTPVMHYPCHVQFGVDAVMWSQRVPVARRGELVAFRLPRNPALHVFAATLQATHGEVAGR